MARLYFAGLAALLAVSCGNAVTPGDDTDGAVVVVPDAGVGFEYSLQVRPQSSAAIFDALSVTIDDLPTMSINDTYAGYGAAQMHQYQLRVWYADTLVGEATYGPGGCWFCELGGPVTSEATGLCLMENGELRFAHTTCYLQGGGCSGDGFCFGPPCDPLGDGCGTERCGRVITYADPLLTRVACVPPGAVPVGGACTVGATGRYTGHDDCVAGAVCLDGTCTRFCYSRTDCGTGQVCTAVPGLLNEVFACTPAP